MKMNYKYIIYKPGQDEDILRSFSTEEQLVHIHPGSHLQITFDGCHQKLDRTLEITNVEFQVHARNGHPPLENARILVYTRDKDRKSLL